jgi:hypothetical protein
MARGTMHAPKPDGARTRRNAPTHGEQLVTDDGVRRGPDLVGSYGPETIAWYETWRTAPQAQLFEATDWSRLALLAPIVDGYFRRPSAAALSEVRMNEERLGATVVDRMRARIRVDRSEEESSSAPVLSIVSARADALARLRGPAEDKPPF